MCTRFKEINAGKHFYYKGIKYYITEKEGYFNKFIDYVYLFELSNADVELLLKIEGGRDYSPSRENINGVGGMSNHIGEGRRDTGKVSYFGEQKDMSPSVEKQVTKLWNYSRLAGIPGVVRNGLAIKLTSEELPQNPVTRIKLLQYLNKKDPMSENRYKHDSTSLALIHADIVSIFGSNDSIFSIFLLLHLIRKKSVPTILTPQMYNLIFPLTYDKLLSLYKEKHGHRMDSDISNMFIDLFVVGKFRLDLYLAWRELVKELNN